MRFIALIAMLTRVELVVFRVVLLLFPPMTLHASVLIRTTVFVVVNELSGAPV
jgi:hypothetical protein